MLKKVEQLPKFERLAVTWAINHWNLVEAICKDEPCYSDEELAAEIQTAIEKGDHAYYALLLYIKIKAKKETLPSL